MRIGVDIRALLDPHPSGVGEYTEHVLRALLRIGRQHTFVLYANAYHLDEDRLHRRFPEPNVVWRLSRIPNRLLHASLWAFRHPTLDRFTGTVDVFFMPNWHFSAFGRRVPRVVLTVHDVTFRRHPQYYSLRRRLWHRLIRAAEQVRTADALLAVSAYTKRELIDLFAVPAERITVVPSAPAPDFATTAGTAQRTHVRRTYHLPPRFGLLLATLEPRKNIEGALMAFDEYCRRHDDSTLAMVVVGAEGWNVNGLRTVTGRLASRDRIRFLGYVPSDLRPALYAESAFFLFPSFAEGFGFPPLEAASQDVPVITSAKSAMPEVVGDAALLVDPHDLGQIQDAIAAVLHDERLRLRLVDAGRQLVRRYSWDQTARATLDVLTAGRDA